MIKDSFTFKKNAWHMQLMRFIWGYEHYDFRNMCPYFWLSLFNVLFSPVLIPLVYTGRIVKALIFMHQEWLDARKKACEEAEEKFRQEVREKIRATSSTLEKDFNLDAVDPMIKDFIDNMFLSKGNPMRKKMNDKFYRIMESIWYREVDGEVNHKVWKDRKNIDTVWAEAYEKEKQEREERQLKAKATRNVIIGNIVSKLKLIFKVLGYALVVAAIYGVYRLVELIIRITPWDKALHYTLIGVGVVLGAATMVGVIFLLVKLVKYLWCQYGEYCVPCQEKRSAIGKVLLIIFMVVVFPFVNLFGLNDDTDTTDVRPGFLVIPFVWVWTGVKTLWQIIVAIKRDNCPGLNWE